MRVVAATNRDLQKMVDEEKFREDLWFRLNVVRIVLPPLRERRGDIPLLARFFVQQVQRALQPRRQADRIRRARRSQEYTWPGNVRQMQHMIERLTILRRTASTARPCSDALTAMESRDQPVETLADAEEEQIRRVLAATGGNKSRAAQIWGSSARRSTANWSA